MIKALKYALLITAAGITASSAALATDVGPYVNIGIGVHLPEDSVAQIHIPASAPGTNYKSDFGTGFIGVGSFGYKWTNGFRTELEAGYRQSDFDRINGVSANGAQKVFSVSANLLYDFDTGSKFTPYLGGGVGVASYKWSNVATSVSPNFNDRTSAFQWQGIAGVNMPVSDRTRVFIEYRYIGASGTQFENRSVGALVTGHDDRSSNILVGFRFALNGPRPEPVAAPPMAAPMAPAQSAPTTEVAPPQPSVPSKFLVFFDFDKSNLRADSRKIVSEAADYAKRNGKVVIVATGHTDTSGPAPYNMSLSERRAETVQAELIKLGIASDEIGVKWKGKSEPLVATGDEVKEPQNRRVEIVLEYDASSQQHQ